MILSALCGSESYPLTLMVEYRLKVLKDCVRRKYL